MNILTPAIEKCLILIKLMMKRKFKESNYHFCGWILIVFGMAMYKVNTAKAAVNTNNSIVSACKIEESMKKTAYLAFFLAVMCAIFGGAIAYVNELTAPIIAEQAMAAEAALFAIRSKCYF